MRSNEIAQVLVEAAEVYEDLEDASPRLDSREAKLALIEYNLREAREGEVEHDIDESAWIARLEQAAKALRAQGLPVVVEKARDILAAQFDEPEDIDVVMDLPAENVLMELREILMDVLAEAPNPNEARLLAEVDEALVALGS